MPIVISYTLQPVTITDMSQLVVRPGNTAGEIIATALTAAAAGAPTTRTARAVNIGTASASVDSANNDLLATIKGIVLPTANGTLIVRQATEIAASGITVKAGSCGFLMDYGT